MKNQRFLFPLLFIVAIIVLMMGNTQSAFAGSCTDDLCGRTLLNPVQVGDEVHVTLAGEVREDADFEGTTPIIGVVAFGEDEDDTTTQEIDPSYTRKGDMSVNSGMWVYSISIPCGTTFQVDVANTHREPNFAAGEKFGDDLLVSRSRNADEFPCEEELVVEIVPSKNCQVWSFEVSANQEGATINHDPQETSGKWDWTKATESIFVKAEATWNNLTDEASIEIQRPSVEDCFGPAPITCEVTKVADKGDKVTVEARGIGSPINGWFAVMNGKWIARGGGSNAQFDVQKLDEEQSGMVHFYNEQEVSQGCPFSLEPTTTTPCIKFVDTIKVHTVLANTSPFDGTAVYMDGVELTPTIGGVEGETVFSSKFEPHIWFVPMTSQFDIKAVIQQWRLDEGYEIIRIWSPAGELPLTADKCGQKDVVIEIKSNDTWIETDCTEKPWACIRINLEQAQETGVCENYIEEDVRFDVRQVGGLNPGRQIGSAYAEAGWMDITFGLPSFVGRETQVEVSMTILSTGESRVLPIINAAFVAPGVSNALEVNLCG